MKQCTQVDNLRCKSITKNIVNYNFQIKITIFGDVLKNIGFMGYLHEKLILNGETLENTLYLFSLKFGFFQ